MAKTPIVSLATIFLLLCVPGIAHAERPPTPREKAAIDQAAHKAYADQYFKVRVSRIEVSTVDRRWATAVVATFRRKEAHAPVDQRMQEKFYRTGRGWVAWFSVAWPDVEMPIGVERDLGFASPAPLLGISGKTVVLIVFGIIVVILLLLLRAWIKDDPEPQEEVWEVRRIRGPRR